MKFLTSMAVAALTVPGGASAKDLPAWTLPKYPSVFDYIRSDVAKLIYGEDRPKVHKICEIRMKVRHNPISGVSSLRKEASSYAYSDGYNGQFTRMRSCQALNFERMSILEKQRLMNGMENQTYKAVIIAQKNGRITVSPSEGTSAYWTNVHFEHGLGSTRMRFPPIGFGIR